LHPKELFTNSKKFFYEAYSSLTRFTLYPHHLIFLTDVETGYLPPVKITKTLEIFNYFLIDKKVKS